MKIKIEKMDYEGRGISHIDGKVTFIKGALPNEVVTAKLVKEEKRFSIYEVEKIIEESSLRIPSFCPYYKECGGCIYSSVSYENSLKLKKESLEELFQKKDFFLKEISITPSSSPLEYRNKICLKVQNGFYGYYKEESHEFIKITTCKLAHPKITSFLQDFSLLNMQNGEIEIRINTNDELLVNITTSKTVQIEKEITNKHKIAGIIINNRCVYGTPYFFMRINHLLYKVDYSSFFQTNFDIASKISNDIENFFDEEDIVYDFYCGVGYFSLQLAKKVKQVLGIEENPKAILNATYNASLNERTNTSFHVGKVEEIIQKIPLSANKVVVDPPRSGLHKTVRKLFLENNFETIVYISCNPKTLLRDCEELQAKYEIIFLKAYDMFPFTKHLESVILLQRKD